MSTIDTSTWSPDSDLNVDIGGIPLNADASIQQTWQAIQMLMAALKGDTAAIKLTINQPDGTTIVATDQTLTVVDNGHAHAIANVTGLQTALDGKAANTSMSGATASADGAPGLVPAPEAGDQDKFLKGDGTWETATASSVAWSDVTGKPSTFTPSSHTHGNLTNDGKLGTASRAVVTDGNGAIGVSGVTATELGYLSGVTSAVQPQLDTKADGSSVFKRADAEAMGFFGSANPPSLSGTTLDMNDIVTPGVYYVDTTWTTAHLPYDTMSNGIVVVYTRGTNYLVKQIIYRQGTSNANDWQTFVRMGYYNSSRQSYDWSDWHRYTTWMENDFILRGSGTEIQMRHTKVASLGSTPASNSYATLYSTPDDGATEMGGFQTVLWTNNNVSSRMYARANVSGSNFVYVELIARTNGAHEVTTPSHTPDTTNKWTLGTSAKRWKEVWTNASAINTSDERIKSFIAPVPDRVLDAWGDVAWLQFKFRDSVAEKGDGARLHSGLVAQRIDAAFRARGLDASAYGLFCYDEWDAVDRDETREVKPAVLDDEGNEVEPAVVEERHVHEDAGDMYSLRYEEALAMEAAYQRRENTRLKERLAALEERLAAFEARFATSEEDVHG